MAGYGPASGFLADPAGSSPLVEASRWVEGTLLGTVATLIAVLCVASMGYMLLSGRLDLRRGATVILGCFILFGSATLVNGLLGITEDQKTSVTPTSVSTISEIQMPNKAPPQYDPYAGASVNRR